MTIFDPSAIAGTILVWTLILLSTLMITWLGARSLVRRFTDRGPLARGEASSRHRGPTLRERLAPARSWLLPDRTGGWWATRTELAVAVVSVGITLAGAAGTVLASTTFGGGPEGRFLLPLGGVAGAVVGFAWMIRIYRAPLRLDAEASWRYRDGR